jgi:hypothetical protein
MRPLTKPAHSPSAKRVPLWLVLSLAAAIGLLIYGATVPKPPSAFDQPDAQSPVRAGNPWDPVHSM